MNLPKEKALKNNVSITLDPDIIDAVKLLCEMDDRNFSQYINMVLRTHVERKRKEGLLDQKAK